MNKKIMSLLIVAVMLIGIGTASFATSAPTFGGNQGSFTLSMAATMDTVTEDSTVLFKVSAKEIDVRQGLTTLNFELNYDRKIIQPIVEKNINILAKKATIKSFDEKSGKITIVTTEFITANTDIFQVQVKPMQGTTGKQMVLTLKNIKGSNGSTSADAVEVSTTVKIGAENIANKNFKGEQKDPKMPEPTAEKKPTNEMPVPSKTEKTTPKPEPKEDPTIADKKNADAGIEDAIVPTMIALSAVILLFTYRYVGINNAKIKNATASLKNIKKDEPMNIDIK